MAAISGMPSYAEYLSTRTLIFLHINFVNMSVFVILDNYPLAISIIIIPSESDVVLHRYY